MATPVLITPLQRLALQAQHGTPAERTAALAQIQQIQAEQSAAAARRTAAQAETARHFEENTGRALSEAGAYMSAQDQPAAPTRASLPEGVTATAQQRRATTSGSSQQVTIERAHAAPPQAPYESSGITSAHGGHASVTVSRPQPKTSAAGEFVTTNRERRPDGSMSVTVVRK